MPKPIRDPLVELLAVTDGVTTWQHIAGYDIRVIEFRAELRRPGEGRGMGVDPGVTTGLAIVNGDVADLWEVKFPSKAKTEPNSRVVRPQLMHSFAHEWAVSLRRHYVAAVEDSSHGAGYGQAVLAENRMALILGLVKGLQRPEIVAIQSVRAAVMGHARINPKDEWEAFLPHDCADALALAVYAAEVMEDPRA